MYLYSLLTPLRPLCLLYGLLTPLDMFVLTVSRNDDFVLLFRETHFAKTGHCTKQRFLETFSETVSSKTLQRRLTAITVMLKGFLTDCYVRGTQSDDFY